MDSEENGKRGFMKLLAMFLLSVYSLNALAWDWTVRTVEKGLASEEKTVFSKDEVGLELKSKLFKCSIDKLDIDPRYESIKAEARGITCTNKTSGQVSFVSATCTTIDKFSTYSLVVSQKNETVTVVLECKEAK